MFLQCGGEVTYPRLARIEHASGRASRQQVADAEFGEGSAKGARHIGDGGRVELSPARPVREHCENRLRRRGLVGESNSRATAHAIAPPASRTTSERKGACTMRAGM